MAEPDILDRCIVVLTIGRSGSSLVSGILHRLGVAMCIKESQEQAKKGDEANPKGYYEDFSLMPINQSVIAGKKVNKPETFQEYINARRNEEGQLWGMKDPRFATTFPSIQPLLGDHRFVVAERKREEVLQSFRKYSRCIGDIEYIESQAAKIEDILADDLIPRIRIQYDLLIKDPKPVVRRLCDFIYDGLDLERPSIIEAVEFVDPDLYRCKE